MSYHIWTADALSSNFFYLSGTCWRVVEAQNRVSTLKLVETLEEQARLEELLEEVKPAYPRELDRYHYLLMTPFRYEPYEYGSRFRRRGQKDGVFYASELVETAMAEIAFYRLLFFKESPDMPIPSNPSELTAFSVSYKTDRAIDLTEPPLSRNESDWGNPTSYEACQFFADEARKVDCELIRSQSVRCPKGGKNISLISWKSFSSSKPNQEQTWRLIFKPTEVIAFCTFPEKKLTFLVQDFRSDPRLKLTNLKANNA